MIDYLHFGHALAEFLPMTKGCSSTVKLSKNGIEELSKKNSGIKDVFSELSKSVKNPILEIIQKAQSNYAIAGFRIQNGENAIVKGVYSTSAYSPSGKLEKMHIEDGDIHLLLLSKYAKPTKL